MSNERFPHIVQDPLNKPPSGIILLQRPNTQIQPPPEEPNPNFPPVEPQLDETILAAINNQRDRSWVLQLECDLEQFLRDPKVTRLDLPPIGSYQRLVVHRVAQYFNLDHAVIGPQGTKRAISLFKNPQSALPQVRLASLVPQYREPVPTNVQIQQPPPPAKSVKILPRIAKPPEPAPVEIKQQVPTKKTPKASSKTLEQREEDYAKARARIFSESEPVLSQVTSSPVEPPPNTPNSLSDPDLSNQSESLQSPNSTPTSTRSPSPVEHLQNQNQNQNSPDLILQPASSSEQLSPVSDHKTPPTSNPSSPCSLDQKDSRDQSNSNSKKRGSKKKTQSHKEPNAVHSNSHSYGSRQGRGVVNSKQTNTGYSRGGQKMYSRGDRMHSYSDPNVPLYNTHPWNDPGMLPHSWRADRSVPVPYSNPSFYYTPGTFQKPIYPQPNLEDQFQRMDLHGSDKFGFSSGGPIESPESNPPLDSNCTVEIRFHSNPPLTLDDPRFNGFRSKGAFIQFLPSNIWIGIFPSFDLTQQAISELSCELFDVIPFTPHL